MMAEEQLTTHDGEFTVQDLLRLYNDILTIDGVTETTVIDSVRLKFTGNPVISFLTPEEEIVIYD